MLDKNNIPGQFEAQELYRMIYEENREFVVIDVRAKKDFNKYRVEGPGLKILNLNYEGVADDEEKAISKIPRGVPLRIYCYFEGGAKWTAHVLAKHGFNDVAYMKEGIRAWSNLIIPRSVHTGESYQLYQFIRPGKASLSYGLVVNDELILFDPAINTDFYLDFAKSRNLRISRILETHLHSDYISGSLELAKETGATIYAHKDDFNGAAFDYSELHDRMGLISVDGNPLIEVLHTMGHTPGSCSFIINKTYLISGDLLHWDSIGQPDPAFKNEELIEGLFDTLKNVFPKLDGELLVLPGQYKDWNESDDNQLFIRKLKDIAQTNRELSQFGNLKELIGVISKQNSKQPEYYGMIREVNAGLTELNAYDAQIVDQVKNEYAIANASR